MRTRSDSIAQARLAYISAGQPPVGGPKRAALASDLDDLERALDELGGEDPDNPEDQSPGQVTQSRGWGGFELTGRHVIAVLVLVAASVVVALAVMATSSATPVVVEVPPDTAEAPRQTAVPSESPEPVLLRIHVLGAVAAPGVIAVPEGSIVQDAILAAGGLTLEADPAQLNMAAPLNSGQQIIVGTQGDPLGEVRDGAGSAGGGAGGALVNLNTASQAQLEELPSVGPVLAGAIITWREDNGGFVSVEDLQEVSGIGPKNFEKLKPLVTV